MGEVTDPGSVSYDPTYKTPAEIRTLSQDPNYGQFFRPSPVVEKPKSGLGTTLKNVALGVLAPQLLAGTALAKPYNLYRQYQTAKKFIPKGVQETIRTAFTPRLTTEKEYTKNLVKRPPKDDRDGPKTTAETITTGTGLEEGQKMLGLNDAQQNYIRKIIAGKDQRELQMIAGKAKISIDSGKASQIEKDVFQIIQEYLV